MNSTQTCRWVSTLLLATFVIASSGLDIAAAADAPEPQPLDGKINWVFDYQEGQWLSKESGKPMFVVFRCER